MNKDFKYFKRSFIYSSLIENIWNANGKQINPYLWCSKCIFNFKCILSYILHNGDYILHHKDEMLQLLKYFI